MQKAAIFKCFKISSSDTIRKYAPRDRPSHLRKADATVGGAFEAGVVFVDNMLCPPKAAATEVGHSYYTNTTCRQVFQSSDIIFCSHSFNSVTNSNGYS